VGNAVPGRTDARQPAAGNLNIHRAANLQPQSNDGWQRGEEPHGNQQRVPNHPGAGPPGINPPAHSAPQPRAPFFLSPQEQANLDQILAAWERQSSTIKTYKCDFTRFEYSTPFGQKAQPDQQPTPRTISTGVLKYSAPDKGMFMVSEIQILNPKTGKYESGGPDDLEHWVCDGKSIFEINHKQKTRTEKPLPPQMQGAAISDGPLPFVFGAKAATLKQRYWLREITPAGVTDAIWLEAHPRFQADAANFRFVEVIIGRKDFMPKAIQMYNPAYDPKRENDSRTVFDFQKTSFNGRFDNVFKDFVGPDVPFHYKKIVLQPLIDQPAAADAQPTGRNERSAQAPKRPPLR
jgi:TIGR03009 family protein